MNHADKATLDELSDLLELLHVDGTVHDLDQWPEDRPTSTLGRVLCGLLHQYDRMRDALLVAAMETDVLGDTNIPLLAYRIAKKAGRGERISDADYIEAYIRATERLQ